MTMADCSRLRSGLLTCSVLVRGPGATTPLALTLQTPYDQRVERQRARMIEQAVELLIVLLLGAREPRADRRVPGLVATPPRRLELEDGSLALAERVAGRRRLIGHSHSLPAVAIPFKHPRDATCVGERRPCAPVRSRHDSYYIERTCQSFAERAAANYDHPDAFDWQLLNDHIAALAAGASVPVPIYDYTTHNRSGDVRVVHPAQIVVVEGILVLYEPTLRERFDLKVYIDTDADLRLIRRLHRDVIERGRTTDSIIAQYLATVRPSHDQFIEPSKRHAHVIFPQGGMNEPALEVLLARVRELVRVDA
jgi:uridine kinase